MLIFLVLTLLTTLAAADNLIRTTCTCISPTRHGYTLLYTYTPSRIPATTLTIHDDCVADVGSGGCNEAKTYLQAHTVTQGDHTFQYQRNFYSPDTYEFDNSGKKNISVKEAQELGNVTE